VPKYRMYKDPDAFAAKLPKLEEGSIRCLGLDLGSNCGVAIYDFVPGKKLLQDKLQLFQWDLSCTGLDSGAARFVRLRGFLNIVEPDAIAYEDVKYTPPKEFFVNKKFGIPAILARVATASEVLGGMKVTVATWAQERSLPSMGFGVTTIKKFATGNGRANKEDMINAANKNFNTVFDPAKYKADGIDNVVDAAFVLLMLLQQVKTGVGSPPKSK
jgi:Holliday junction resolvasome RuvABC endonuclease subunit